MFQCVVDAALCLTLVLFIIEGDEEVQSVKMDFSGYGNSPTPDLMDLETYRNPSYHEIGRPSILQLAEDEAAMTSNVKHFGK